MFGGFQTSQTGGHPYSGTSPDKVSEYYVPCRSRTVALAPVLARRHDGHNSFGGTVSPDFEIKFTSISNFTVNYLML